MSQLSAPSLTEDQVLNAGILRDTILSVQTKVIARSYQIEKDDPDEARRLMSKVSKIRPLWLEMKIRDDEHMTNQISHWSGLIREFNAGREQAFWDAVDQL